MWKPAIAIMGARATSTGSQRTGSVELLCFTVSEKATMETHGLMALRSSMQLPGRKRYTKEMERYSSIFRKKQTRSNEMRSSKYVPGKQRVAGHLLCLLVN